VALYYYICQEQDTTSKKEKEAALASRSSICTQKNANLCCQKAPVAAYIDPEKSDLRSSSGEEMKRATLR
jgi:hypothetical protein